MKEKNFIKSKKKKIEMLSKIFFKKLQLHSNCLFNLQKPNF